MRSPARDRSVAPASDAPGEGPRSAPLDTQTMTVPATAKRIPATMTQKPISSDPNRAWLVSDPAQVSAQTVVAAVSAGVVQGRTRWIPTKAITPTVAAPANR